MLVCSLLPGVPSAGEEPRIGVTLRVSEGPDGLKSFLLERILQTWENAEVLDETRETDELLTVFNVAIDWLSSHQLSVLVEQDGQPLTDRTIEVQDPLQAKLTLWILLKSTLNRGLKQAHLRTADDAPLSAAGSAEPAADPPPPPEPAPATPPLATPDAPPAAALPAPIEPAPPLEVRAEAEAAPVSHPVHTAWGALPTIWLETPKLFSAGLYGTFSFSWHFLTGAVQLGYRYTDGVHGLTVHGLPLTLLFGGEWGTSVRAAAGVLLTGELKIPVARGISEAVVGAEGGAFVQARVSVGEQAFLILRPAVTCRMARMQYEYTDPDGVDRQTRELPCTVVISAGMEWR